VRLQEYFAAQPVEVQEGFSFEFNGAGLWTFRDMRR
jgi:hypothetical protein